MNNKLSKNILWFKDITNKDVPLVGGKNASLGEMFSKLSVKGVPVPDGFALTSSAFWYFLKENKIYDQLKEIFKNLNAKDIDNLNQASKVARNLVLGAEFPEDLKKMILESYQKLSKKYGSGATDVAVRSSATAEDLPNASFAGQHETYLNVRGEKALLDSIKKGFSSLYLARAISYREEKKFSHMKIALSIGVQKMVRSDLASSGVMFTIDTETGFSNAVIVSSIYGVGEMIVKGKITPDEFIVFKPLLKQGFKSIVVKNLGRKNRKYIFDKAGGLKEVDVLDNQQLKFSITDDEALKLAKWACVIEEHYKRPQDIEWAKDGKTGDLFIVQSRPETVETLKNKNVYEEYILKTKAKPILQGIGVGDKIGSGKVRLINDVAKINEFQKGEVLVTKMTDPDWMPAMRVAAAIVTEEGARTCHAAIVSRELGVPCIVGTGNATKILKNEQEITVDCSQGGNGRVFAGKVGFSVKKYNLREMPKMKTKIMVNIGEPQAAFKASFLPQSGVGLAREEFIISEKIKIHPLALYHYKKLKAQSAKCKVVVESSKLKKIIKQIDNITIEHKDKKEFFVKELAEGVGQIAAAFWPKPVILRLSDFKTNEYRALVGGELFEPQEENPMLGWRGASRYYDPKFKPAFLMECQAIKRARDVFGLKNLKVMVPFCRTPEEGKKVLAIMKQAGLEQGVDGLEFYVMCEIPSNILLADKFLDIFDGVSIGSNDLTQLVLGIDRDNSGLSHIGDERNEAVKKMLIEIIKVCRKRRKYCGICGEAPSNYPEFAKFLVEQSIQSMSLNPDSVIKTILHLKKI